MLIQIWNAFPEYSMSTEDAALAFLLLNPNDGSSQASDSIKYYFPNWPDEISGYDAGIAALKNHLSPKLAEAILSNSSHSESIASPSPKLATAILESQKNSEGLIAITIHPDFNLGTNESSADNMVRLRYERALEFLERSNHLAGIGYWELDLVNQKLTWSSETKRIHEVPEEYTPVLDTAIHFYPEGKYRDRITQLIKNAIDKGEHFDETLQIKTAKGKLNWVRSVGIPEVVNGTTIGVYGLFQDIHQSKVTETELQKNENLFRQTFEYASIGMALVGLNGKWLQVNQSLCRFLEYSEAELKQRSFQDITHADDLNLDLDLLGQCLEGSMDNYQMEKRYLTKSGQTVWALLAVSLVKDAEGTPLHFISQITNIDASKRLLERVQDQNERLINFAHIVSHNLRSHSANTALMLDMLKLDAPQVSELQSYKHLTQASENLDETIYHLSEITAMQLETNEHLEALDPWPFVEKNLKLLETDFNAANATISLHCENKVKAYGVAAYLDSILFNLLSNAIKYRSPDKPLQLEIRCQLDGDYLSFDFVDNGIGIDLERHGDKLFGLYKTFHHNEDAKGVGLFISRNQAEAMGGSLTAESKPDAGSTFTLRLKTAPKELQEDSNS